METGLGLPLQESEFELPPPVIPTGTEYTRYHGYTVCNLIEEQDVAITNIRKRGRSSLSPSPQPSPHPSTKRKKTQL